MIDKLSIRKLQCNMNITSPADASTVPKIAVSSKSTRRRTCSNISRHPQRATPTTKPITAFLEMSLNVNILGKRRKNYLRGSVKSTMLSKSADTRKIGTTPITSL